MKKISIALIFACTLFIQSSYKAHATAVIGATFPQQIVDLVVQVKSFYDEHKAAIDTAMATFKTTVMDSVGNALIATAQQQAADDIINWANGGFQGTPSIISNPEGFIKSKGLESVKASLTAIDKKNPYSYTVLNSVYNAFRGKESIQIQIQNEMLAELPGLIQKSVCDDTKLNEIAREDTKNPDGTINLEAYTLRKIELYNNLCDPSLGAPENNPALTKKLTEVNNQRPDLVGEDGILAISAGENDYAKSVRITNLAEQANKEAVQKITDDSKNGGGVFSQRKCKKFAFTKDDEGNDMPNPPCEEYEVTTPSSLVQGAAKNSITSGLDRLTNITGDGALSGIITSFATGFLLRAITKEQQSSSYTSNVSLDAPSAPTNISVTTVSNQQYTQNLTNDPKTKASLLDPLEKLLRCLKTI